MVGQLLRDGKKVLERRLVVVRLEVVAGSIAGVEIILEIRAEVDLFERVPFFRRVLSHGHFFLCRALPLRIPARYVVQQRDMFFYFFQHWIFNDFRVDHLLQLELVQRQHADHLHQARREYLPLRNFEAQLWLKKRHYILTAFE